MAKPLLPDASWAEVGPPLPRPKRRRSRYPGREPLTPRRALTGIPPVLRTGLRWNDLPRGMGCGSGSRCRRHLEAWHRAGAWGRPHAVLPAGPDDAGAIDWSRAAADAPSVRAPSGGGTTGRSPVGRGRRGSEHHAVADPHGIPPGATTAAADAPGVAARPGAVGAAPVVRRRRGRRERRPKGRYADRACDGDPHRRRVRRRGTDPRFARRPAAHGGGPGEYRRPAERFFARLHRYRRLRPRADRDDRVHDALPELAVCLICLGFR